MKNLLFLLVLSSLVSPVTAQSLLGPRSLNVNEEGEITAAAPKPQEKPFDNLWAYRLYPEAEKKILRGKGVNIAILDSGISANAEFNGKNVKMQDFTLSGHMDDSKGHGTALAGVIGAKGVQFTGIAPEAKLCIFKVDDGGPTIGPQAVAAGLNGVLQYNAKNPSDRISVVNLSYGVENGGLPALSQAVRELYKSGVVIVAPAGNYGFPGVHYPASMPEVIAVSALAADGHSAYSSSSYGPKVEFIAPGDRVLSASPDGNYTLISGTSIAVGFVSAAAVLAVESYVKKNNAYPDVEQVRSLLRGSAKKIKGVADVKQGYGFIDVAALEK